MSFKITTSLVDSKTYLMGQETKCQLKFLSNEMVISRNESGIGRKAPPEKFAEYRREPDEFKAFSSEILT